MFAAVNRGFFVMSGWCVKQHCTAVGAVACEVVGVGVIGTNAGIGGGQAGEAII